MTITLSIPTPSEPFINFHTGGETFRLQACEGMGINGQVAHHTTDGIHYAGTGEWFLGDGVAIHKRVINTYPQLKYEILVAVREPDTVELAFSIRNLSGVPWSWPSQANMCFQFAGTQYVDTDGYRTYIPQDGIMKSVRSIFLPETENNMASFYLPGVPGIPVSRQICGCIIARTNTAMDKYSGFFFDASPNLFANFAQNNCIHAAAPIGPLAHNQLVTSRGRIQLNAASLNDICLEAQVT